MYKSITYTIFKCNFVYFNIYLNYHRDNNKEDCTKTEGLKDTEIVYTRIYRRKAFNLTTYPASFYLYVIVRSGIVQQFICMSNKNVVLTKYISFFIVQQLIKSWLRLYHAYALFKVKKLRI